MSSGQSDAPGAPGLTPRWTSSAKDGVGTATDNNSRLWFTVSHGIVDEVYYPFIDVANTRDMGFIVTGPNGFFSEEKRDAKHEIAPLAPGVPGYQITNTCADGKYRLVKTIFADPTRDVLLQKITFTALQGARSDYRLFVLLAPHIGDQGAANRGSVGNYKGLPLLCARREKIHLALACSVPFKARSVGYVGVSDGWRQLRAHGELADCYETVGPGNIALTGEIDLSACSGECVVALSFGGTEAEAGLLCRATLMDSFDDLKKRYVQNWTDYQKTLLALKSPSKDAFPLYQTSVAVLKTHEGKRIKGGIVASLSMPWGASRGDKDTAGYHVVWPRDQVEAAGAQLAVGDTQSARDTLFYLMATQDENGRWPQNMWLDGTAYWDAVQADETAFPILLAGLLMRESALQTIDPWPMVRQAAVFLAKNGPSTQQDRWEANKGISVFTLASIIAALLVAAEFADKNHETDLADYLRQTADCWNARMETWTYVRNTPLAKQNTVDGYYVRLAPPGVAQTGAQNMGKIPLKNQPPGNDVLPAEEIISPDALALVRFGLRAPNDPKILSTIKAIDATLKSELSTGPGWHRYSHDGYGEKPSGAPYDGSGGVGRCWPLLAGERAHYELAAGNKKEAEHLLTVMAAQTSAGGMLPEQVWDTDDIPDRELYNGHPSGSGMPLAWAHAEFLKLARSLHEGKIFDMPAQAAERYAGGKNESPLVPWRFTLQSAVLPKGKTLRIEAHASAVVRWSDDDWKTHTDTTTKAAPVGLFVADLPTRDLPADATVRFTFHWEAADTWEGENFTVTVAEAQ